MHRLQIGQPAGESVTVCEGNATRSYSALVDHRIDVHFSSRPGSLNGLDLEFSLFYLLASDPAAIVDGSTCDQIFRSSRHKMALMADRLLLKNHRQLACNYTIEAPVGYRIQLDVKQLTFDPIRQCGNVADCTTSKATILYILISKNFKKFLFLENRTFSVSEQFQSSFRAVSEQFLLCSIVAM